MKKKQIVTLNGMGAERRVNIVFEPGMKKYLPGDKVKVFIRPDSVVLSSQFIATSSFQNQIRGMVEKITDDGPRVLCLVNCGFPLMAEVSRAAAEQLKLQTGIEMYCLFKSLALDSIQI